jgi:branched-chain amino acid transport system permease protein
MTSILEIITSDYGVHLAILVSLYLLLAQSLNLTFGLGQLFNLAHVASYAVGAYATALLSTDYGGTVGVCVASSVTVSALFALLLGVIALRLSTDYFAIGTLAFSSVISALLINWKSVTHGVLGVPGIPRPELFGIDFYQNANFLALIGIAAVLTQVVLYLLYRSPFGRSLRSLAEFERAAASLGKNTRRTRNIAFCVSSAFAGLAGSFFAYYLNYVDPSSFGVGEMVFILTIVIVGSPGSFWGVIGATAFLVLLPEPLRFLDISSAYLGPMRQLLHALILFLVVWWKRDKLFPQRRTV